jgi:hypothetical protein
MKQKMKQLEIKDQTEIHIFHRIFQKIKKHSILNEKRIISFYFNLFFKIPRDLVRPPKTMTSGPAIRAEQNQIAPITRDQRRTINDRGYLIGDVIAIYLSSAITHKARIDAVDAPTSVICHKLHKKRDGGGLYNSNRRAKGITRTPTQRSATANETT